VFLSKLLVLVLDLPILEKVLAIPIQIYILKQYCNTLAILKSVLAILSIAIHYRNINNPDDMCEYKSTKQ